MEHQRPVHMLRSKKLTVTGNCVGRITLYPIPLKIIEILSRKVLINLTLTKVWCKGKKPRVTGVGAFGRGFCHA
jgi:hypothetical protein